MQAGVFEADIGTGQQSVLPANGAFNPGGASWAQGENDEKADQKPEGFSLAQKGLWPWGAVLLAADLVIHYVLLSRTKEPRYTLRVHTGRVYLLGVLVGLLAECWQAQPIALFCLVNLVNPLSHCSPKQFYTHF